MTREKLNSAGMGHGVYCTNVVKNCNIKNELKDKQTFGLDRSCVH